ncbi:hypothetical protein P4561_11520 [Priestia flexa]|nr:hypothetical protein [Priestia flexa]
MVSYQVHRSADYLDYRKSKLKDINKKKSGLFKRLEKLGGKT